MLYNVACVCALLIDLWLVSFLWRKFPFFREVVTDSLMLTGLFSLLILDHTLLRVLGLYLEDFGINLDD